jgi:hypothetical protein
MTRLFGSFRTHARTLRRKACKVAKKSFTLKALTPTRYKIAE